MKRRRIHESFSDDEFTTTTKKNTKKITTTSIDALDQTATVSPRAKTTTYHRLKEDVQRLTLENTTLRKENATVSALLAAAQCEIASLKSQLVASKQATGTTGGADATIRSQSHAIIDLANASVSHQERRTHQTFKAAGGSSIQLQEYSNDILSVRSEILSLSSDDDTPLWNLRIKRNMSPSSMTSPALSPTKANSSTPPPLNKVVSDNSDTKIRELFDEESPVINSGPSKNNESTLKEPNQTATDTKVSPESVIMDSTNMVSPKRQFSAFVGHDPQPLPFQNLSSFQKKLKRPTTSSTQLDEIPTSTQPKPTAPPDRIQDNSNASDSEPEYEGLRRRRKKKNCITTGIYKDPTNLPIVENPSQANVTDFVRAGHQCGNCDTRSSPHWVKHPEGAPGHFCKKCYMDWKKRKGEEDESKRVAGSMSPTPEVENWGGNVLPPPTHQSLGEALPLDQPSSKQSSFQGAPGSFASSPSPESALFQNPLPPAPTQQTIIQSTSYSYSNYTPTTFLETSSPFFHDKPPTPARQSSLQSTSSSYLPPAHSPMVPSISHTTFLTNIRQASPAPLSQSSSPSRTPTPPPGTLVTYQAILRQRCPRWLQILTLEEKNQVKKSFLEWYKDKIPQEMISACETIIRGEKKKGIPAELVGEFERDFRGLMEGFGVDWRV
ncbi:hypothetical protein HDV05_005293 [Chytridiales sp. JEL 0842]|nr:hypothetical protein HDV05_005293 [Chytridiales sp. JEL 0842]